MVQTEPSTGITSESWQWHRGSRFRKMTGALLLVAGFFWFAKMVGWIPAVATGTHVFWPVVVVAVGAFMLWGSRRRRQTNRSFPWR